MARKTKTQHRSLYDSLIACITENLLGEPTLVVASRRLPPAGVIAALQEYVTAAEKTARAHALWVDAVYDERQVEKRTHPYALEVKWVLQAIFGPESTTMLKYRLAVLPRRPKSVETRRIAAEKARATRKKRGTLGKRQKMKIKG